MRDGLGRKEVKMNYVFDKIGALFIWALEEARRRSPETKEMQKKVVFFSLAFAVSIGGGGTLGHCHNVAYNPDFGRGWSIWFLVGFFWTLALFISIWAYRKLSKRFSQVDGERMRLLNKISEAPVHHVRHVEEIPAMAEYQIDIPLDRLDTEDRFIDWGHSDRKLGTAFDWAKWIDDPILGPQSLEQCKKLQRIADKMQGTAWQEVALELLNRQKKFK